MPPPNKAATINDSRVQPWPLWLGLGIVVLVLSPVFIAFSYLFFANLGGISTELFSANWFWRILKFSVLQASLSASISLIGGWLLGRSLFFSRTRFKRAYLAMLNLCFVLPVIVLVLALLLFWGNRGLMAELTQLQWNLYGLTGILLAHCFLNIPYAARLIYASYGRIPGNYWKLAQQCRMSLWLRWVIIEWPAIKAAVGHSAVLIFLLCFNSFSAVLTLGGGPKSTTLEVAVYQAIKSEFNFDKALTLSLVHMVLVSLVVFIAAKWLAHQPQRVEQQSYKPMPVKMINSAVLLIFALFFISPFAYLLQRVLVDANWSLLLESRFLLALLNSVWVASISALSTLLLAWLLCRVQLHWRDWRWINGGLNWLMYAIFLMPSMILGIALFLMLRPWVSMNDQALFLVVYLNMLMALPFAIAKIKPVLHDYYLAYAKLLAQLPLSHWQQIWRIQWPFLRRPLLQAGALAWVLSIGDLGIIALVGHNDFTTLPLLVYQYLGRFQLQSALLIAMVMLILCYAIFWLATEKHDA